MMLITGASGFLGSCLAAHLNAQNFNYLIASDHFEDSRKNKNLDGKKLQQRVDYAQLLNWLDEHCEEVEFILHFADTAPYNDLAFFQEIWERGVRHQIPLLFDAKPMMEEWISTRSTHPFYWAGLRLPQVYGPNEYHLGPNASWVYRVYQELEGNQQNAPFTTRLVYIKDVVAVGYFLINQRQRSGIYSFNNAPSYPYKAVTQAMALAINSLARHNKPITPTLSVVDSSLLTAGYTQPFYRLAEGIADYIEHYLGPHHFW